MNKTLIIGIDCAVEDKNTGVAVGVWSERDRQLNLISKHGSNKFLTKTIIITIKGTLNQSDRILLAFDAPLGWPIDMGKQLSKHIAGNPLPVDSNQLFRRETDRFIKNKFGKQSLDVGADKIARTAHAALNLLNEVRKKTNRDFPLVWKPNFTGTGVIEVYPAATLTSHGVTSSGYKGEKNIDLCNDILEKLGKIRPSTNLSSLTIEDDNELDAIICVLAGADFLDGLALNPENDKLAEKEGWIWVRDKNGSPIPPEKKQV